MKRVALTAGRKTDVSPYLHALQRHFQVEVVYPDNEQAQAKDFDGIVLAGGADISPGEYYEPKDEQTKNVDSARDRLERRFLRSAIDNDMPVLAICRGMQMLNVAQGGKLIQDLPQPNPHKQQKSVLDAHPITVTGTRLAEILGTSELTVNSRHHQALMPTALGDGVVVTATASDVIEAVELPTRAFVIGVQWHPEDRAVADRTPDRRLFAAFADAVNR